MRLPFAPFLILLLLLGLSTGGLAQAVPDAGSLRQQIEQPRAVPALPPAAAPRASAAAEPRTDGGPRLTVQRFRLSGNSLLSDAQLAPALADFVGRETDFAGLRRAADAVAAAYRQAGWLARVTLPEQDVSLGVVTLQVAEARYAGLRFEGPAPQRVKREAIAAYFARQQREGEPLNADRLDRALLLADDLPGVGVAGTLAPGQAEGETTLVLQTTDEPLLYGDIGMDNTGPRSTGSARVTASLNLNSPLGQGDLASLNLMHSRGSDYGRLGLTLPVGRDGLRLGLSGSAMRYKVIAGPGAATTAPIQGSSSSIGVDWNQPLLRERLRNLYFTGGLERKRFSTEDTQVRSDYASDNLRLALSGNRFDDLGGGGANSASVGLQWGHLSRMRAHTLKGSIEPGYFKLDYAVSRQQNISEAHSLYLSLQGQHANQVLDSSEKFYIGGAQTVRAYPASELGGERGQLLTGEWRWRARPDWLLSAFADIGRVVQLPATSSDQRLSLQLRGHGLGLIWQGPKGMVARLTWSQRNGSNPKPTLAGTDGDGTRRQHRVWLTTSLPF
ncbi:MAG TPA: ShlB/FhaC/HecB family hemolysin secretion/activation protein [Aquabacterium sp.]|nr:ShlB/FhaC/HecB family hemolysin secretion/activation protein [Aquabacterium sp.]HQC94421.1 ShlB/FhaC/HecB family hemolysin secretion/activation protein [Aquabacterium sp.]